MLKELRGGQRGVVAHKAGDLLVWRQTNPVTGDELETDAQGRVTGKAVLDPEGVALGDANPFAPPAGGETGGDGTGMSQAQMNSRYAQLLPPSMGGGSSGGQRCRLEGFSMGCGFIASLAATGLVAAVPNSSAAIYGNGRTRLSGTRWHDAWEPCAAGDVCARNVGYFEDAPDLGGPLNTEIGPTKPIPEQIVTDITRMVNKALGNPTCSSYLTQLLHTVADLMKVERFGTDMSELFKQIQSQGGIVEGPNGLGVHTIDGSINDGDAKIVLAPRSTVGWRFIENRLSVAETVLHETIHHSRPGRATYRTSVGNFNDLVSGDQSLARAAYKLANPTTDTVPDFINLSEASKYWNAQLELHCFPPKLKGS